MNPSSTHSQRQGLPFHVWSGLALLTLLIPWQSALAQTPELVKDINTTLRTRASSSPLPAHGYPGNVYENSFRKLGAHTYFSARDGIHGRELWRTDGTSSGTILVADVNPGSGDSSPYDMVALGSSVIFRADDGKNGPELWITNATASGTKMLRDIRPGTVGSSPTDLTSLGSAVLFTADDGSNGAELWITDGTPTGTIMLKDIQVGTGGSSPKYLRADAAGGLVYFKADDGSNGAEPWISDGTTAGTKMLKNIHSTSSSLPDYFVPVGRNMFFTANDGATGAELWSSDGTAAGTQIVMDTRSGYRSGSYLHYAVVLGGKLYFRGNDGSSGNEIWVSDGTGAGTRMVKDINPGAGDGGFKSPAVVGNKIYFQATDSSYNFELWGTDGSAMGTGLVKEIVTGVSGSSPEYITPLGGSGKFVFRARYFYLFAYVDALWVSDGTSSGTSRISNLRSYYLTQVQPGKAIFVPWPDFELFETDGTSAGTKLLKDINRNDPTKGSAPSNLTDVLGQLFFRASDGTSGSELWMSDGTATGTKLVKDIHPTGSSNPKQLLEFGGKLYFCADDGAKGEELWASDGTTTGTKLVKDIRPGTSSSSVTWLAVAGGKMYCAANDGTHGAELWTSDGTAVGTSLLKDIEPGTNSASPSEFTELNGVVLFSATSGNDRELWVTDGTAAGTKLLANLSARYPSNPQYLTRVGNRVFFQAFEGRTYGNELYVTDGTSLGTKMFKDIWPGTQGGTPSRLTAVGNKLFFTATHAVSSLGLWVSDGSSSGTTLLLSGGADRLRSSADGTLLYFIHSDGVHGSEPWVSDGTAAGTQMIKDIKPGSVSSSTKWLYSYSSNSSSSYAWGRPVRYLTGSRHVWFFADDGTHGPELWVSDGTAAGTKMVKEILTVRSPPTTSPVLSGGTIFFTAEELQWGSELWKVDPGATAQAFGYGCAAATTVPNLNATDPVLGQKMTISLSEAPASASSILFLSVPSPVVNLTQGCFVYLNLGIMLPLAYPKVGASGSWSLTFTVPNDPTLKGISSTMQAGAGPTSTPPLHTDLSNALMITPGN